MSSLGQFKSAFVSGVFPPDASAVSALSLIFERTFLPNNVEFVTQIARSGFSIRLAKNDETRTTLDDRSGLFEGLNEEQRATCAAYIEAIIVFTHQYAVLFKEGVFETDLYADGKPYDVELVQEIPPLWRARWKDGVTFAKHGSTVIQDRIASGYFPVLFRRAHIQLDKKPETQPSTRDLASLLALSSVQLALPATREVQPDLILEARNKLADHLPPFWSAMLRLTRELRTRLEAGALARDVTAEAQDLVDAVVLPAAIDLKRKMELERRQFFYRILAPVHKGLRLIIGRPPLTVEQLIANALAIGSDVAIGAATQMLRTEIMEKQGELTFLIKADEMLSP